MTILFLISSEGHYGVENMVVTLARTLRDLGCRCIIGVFRDSRAPHTEVGEEAQEQGLQVEFIPCKGRLDCNAVAHIRGIVERDRVDVLHPQGYKSDIYAYASTLGQSRALVATSHNWPSRLPTMRAYAALDRMVLRTFDRVVVVSEQVRDRLLHSGVSRKRVCTIPNGVDVERLRLACPTLRSELHLSGRLIGFVGRFVPDKGGEILLRAAEQVLRDTLGVTFVFIGDGPCRESWEELATELGIRQSVIFTGARKDMPAVYASMDIVVLPSLVEAMPMCLLEAMAAGKPVIATNVGTIPAMVLPEQTGLLVDPGDAGQLANSIIRLLSDYELSEHLGKAARTAVVQRFSAEAMARKYIGVYEQALAKRGRTQKPTADLPVSA